jgi:nucleoside-diphosphate-sugar epimerase
MTLPTDISRPFAAAAREKKLFCFGYGYTAAALASVLRGEGWHIAGTTTDPDKRAQMAADGIEAELFEPTRHLPDPFGSFRGVTHVLLSIPPTRSGDPAFEAHAHDLLECGTIEWAGYLSTTGVYGNHDGGWIDEETPLAPTSQRGSQRARAEEQWQSLALNEDFPLHIFRLSGIYGPGRSALDTVRSGTARRIDKPGHVFNRIHVDDIVQTLLASIEKPNAGAVYNLADDYPSSSHEVIAFACNLLGLCPPEMVAYEQVDVAPMVRSFYSDNKRVKNDRIKHELGVTLRYPDYRAGLQACMDAEDETEALLSAP